MASQNVRGILAAFTPSFDFCATSAGDGRIKIWNTLKGQLQTDFVDIVSNDGAGLSRRGHLSVDYTCMKWMHVEAKDKGKGSLSLLIVGTGSGDLLAIDISVGQLKWQVSDCHPGGVNAVSTVRHSFYVYSAGSDGMVCQFDGKLGSVLMKSKLSSKSISSISISPDGKLLALASAQLKVFNCSNLEKMQKFSGHPSSVRCMTFSENGKYIFSSAIGERFIAAWEIGGTKKKSSCCVLSMEHPAVFLDAIDSDSGISVLAISEIGVCYFWFGTSMKEVQNLQATKISLHVDHPHSNSRPTIFAGGLQGSIEPAVGVGFIAYGSIVKPTFKKLHVHYGEDISLDYCPSGVLFPQVKPGAGDRKQSGRKEVTALDRANAKDALFPFPKFPEFHHKKKKKVVQLPRVDQEMLMPEGELCHVDAIKQPDLEDAHENVGDLIENKLRSLGLLVEEEAFNGKELKDLSLKISTIGDVKLLLQSNQHPKKIRMIISSLPEEVACKFLQVLMSMWLSRSCPGKDVLLWVYTILRYHGQYILSQEVPLSMLDCVFERTNSRGTALESLAHLSGCLQLALAQINKGNLNNVVSSLGDACFNDSESEEVDELVFGEDSVSETNSEEYSSE